MGTRRLRATNKIWTGIPTPWAMIASRRLRSPKCAFSVSMSCIRNCTGLNVTSSRTTSESPTQLCKSFPNHPRSKLGMKGNYRDFPEFFWWQFELLSLLLQYLLNKRIFEFVDIFGHATPKLTNASSPNHSLFLVHCSSLGRHLAINVCAAALEPFPSSTCTRDWRSMRSPALWRTLASIRSHATSSLVWRFRFPFCKYADPAGSPRPTLTPIFYFRVSKKLATI